MNRIYTLASAALVGACLIGATAQAQSSGGPYRIERGVIAGGGGAMGSGTYRLRGTLGQAAIARSAAGNTTFHSGFWTPTNDPTDRIFSNGFEP